VSKAFKNFIGADSMKNFRVDKIKLIHNEEILTNFVHQYNIQKEMSNKPLWQIMDQDEQKKEQQQEIMNFLLGQTNNISGDEQTNLILFGTVEVLLETST